MFLHLSMILFTEGGSLCSQGEVSVQGGSLSSKVSVQEVSVQGVSV